MKQLDPKIDRTLYQGEPKVFPQEVVYEVTTEANGLPFGIAIADIEQSTPHFHKVTFERYVVVQGILEVTLNTTDHVLNPGDGVDIPAGVIHTARSMTDVPARVVVISIPEWSQRDYFLAQDHVR